VLALTENPFDLFGNGPCLLVRLSPSEQRKTDRVTVSRTVRKRLGEMTEIAIRVRDLSGAGRFPRCGYPVDLALRGPELDDVREWAKKLGERLERSKKLSDVWVSRASEPQPQVYIDIDRERVTKMGVAMRDLFDVLQVYAGVLYVNDFNKFGRTWRVQVQAEKSAGKWQKEFGKLKVRNREGQMVPLAVLATVRETTGCAALDFLDGAPMLGITANLGAGATGDEVRKLCEAAAEEVRRELRLSREYRVTWFQDLAGAK
jgi:multidrug efflux pump subunit AcrB